MGSRVLLALGGACLLVAACNAITGVGDLAESDLLPDGGTLNPPGSNPPGVVPGVPPGTTPPAPGSLQQCGIGGGAGAAACVVNSDGWTPAATLTFGSSCPTGFNGKIDYQQASGECGCNCTVTSGSCEGPVTIKSGPACGASNAPMNVGTGNACTAVTFPAGPSYEVTPAPPTPPSGCSGTTKNTFASSKLSVCTTTTTNTFSPNAGSCGAGTLCMAPTGGFFGLGSTYCAVHDGDVECPTSLPNKTSVGKSLTDNRSCGTTCNCEPEPCSGTLRVYSSGSCANTDTSGTIDVSSNPTCQPPSGAPPPSTIAAVEYSVSGGCRPAGQVAPVGNVKFQDPKTICCAPSF